MYISIASVISCMISSSIFIILLFFILKNNKRLGKIGIVNVYIFAIFVLMRAFLPIEIYKIDLSHTYIPQKITNFIITNYIVDAVVQVQETFCIVQLIAFAWIAGVIYTAKQKISGYFYCKKMLKEKIFFPSGTIKSAYQKATKRVFADNHILKRKELECKFAIMEQVNSPAVFGYFHPVILLPPISYTEQELEHIICHELFHIKHKDFILKIIRDILCIVYWWNPFISKIFPALMDQLQELYVDYDMNKMSDKEQKLAYLKTIQHTVKHAVASKNKKLNALYSFCDINYNESVMQRLYFITQFHLKKISKRIVAIIGIVICLSFLSISVNSITSSLFTNENGERFTYFYSKISEKEVIKEVEKEGIEKFESPTSPENAKIGDVFKGKNGYERVIAVSDDGGFITESVDEP